MDEKKEKKSELPPDYVSKLEATNVRDIAEGGIVSDLGPGAEKVCVNEDCAHALGGRAMICPHCHTPQTAA